MAYIKLSSLLIFAYFSGAIDLAVSSYFYPFPDTPLLDAIYILGPIPGWVVVIASAVGLFLKKYRSYRSIFLYLIATLAIGSGLIVHEALKEHWGRARPKQIAEFGGKDRFTPFYEPHFQLTETKHRSFASGHVTMGFFFFTFYFIGQRFNNRQCKLFGIALSFILGTLLTYARIAQGGHFFSDAVGSMIVMYLTAYLLTPLLTYERLNAKAS